METNTPANELETGDQGITTDANITNTENEVTEDAKPASIWRPIEAKESIAVSQFTEALETSQGVLVKVTTIYATNNVSSSMAFIPAVKIVELHDGSLTIK